MKRTKAVGKASLLALALGGAAWAQEAGRNPEDLFKTLDKNGDGLLKADEVGEERARFFERLVRVADKDGNGALSREEFIAGSRNEERPAGDRPAGDRPEGRPGEGRPDGRRIFERLDANKDGKVSKDEIPEEFRARMNPIFERLGKNEVTQEELGRAMAQAGGRPEGAPPAGRPAEGRPGEGRPGEGRPEGRLPRIFQLADTNGDGRVSKEELGKLAEKFNELDENKDGQLDPRELLGPPPGGPREGRPEERRPEGARPEGNRPEGARPEAGRPEAGRPEPGRPEGTRPAARPEGRPGEQVGELFRRQDKNSDGKISKDEAENRIKENFDSLDADKDGFLTREEIARGLARRAQEGGERRRPEGERPPEKKPE